MKKFRQLSPFVKIVVILLIIAIFSFLFVAFANVFVISSTMDDITDVEGARKMNAECVIVLGAGVDGATGTLSWMLKHRLDTAIELYKSGAAPKLLMSGDHGRIGYDEVNAMKNYAIKKGVPSSDIFMDHAGFSTYETMYRANYIFGVKRAVVVTQKFHIYRALYNAKRFGIVCVGVNSDQMVYSGHEYLELREKLSRTKDFVYTIIKPKPKFLGEKYSINGDGDVTND